MSNYLTTEQDQNLDRFHQDMVNEAMLDTLDLWEDEAREWSPVPAEFRDMSIAEVAAEIDDMWEATR